MDAVAEGSGGRVSRDCIGLVTSRAAVGELLKLDNLIDLVIPRGSGTLVNTIKVDICGVCRRRHGDVVVVMFWLWSWG